MAIFAILLITSTKKVMIPGAYICCLSVSLFVLKQDYKKVTGDLAESIF